MHPIVGWSPAEEALQIGVDGSRKGRTRSAIREPSNKQVEAC